MVRAAAAEEEISLPLWDESDEDEVDAGLQEVKSGVNWFKIEGGKSGKFKSIKVRLFPPRLGASRKRWYLWAHVHRNVGPKKRSVRCLNDLDLPCPVCALAEQLKRAGEEKASDALWARTSGLVNVVAYAKNDEGKYTGKLSEEGVQVWSPSVGPLTKLINLIKEEYPDERGTIASPKIGRDITIRRTGSGTGKPGEGDKTEWEFRIAETQTVFNGGDFSLVADMYDLDNDPYPVLDEPKLLAMANQKALPAHDPFADDDDNVVDAEFEEVLAEAAVAAPAAKAPKAGGTKARAAAEESAREALRQMMQADATDDGDEDDEDNDGDEDDD